ncbi:cAMP-responsive element-binding protein-like 2 [Strongylocentrotus purpuratus]|uniref:BZIP domain-containing protein n=1 Tax=Strongylocentrotus purpuratus TaxID=7668 RepID=A0A7M7GID8_STRPU|nr:cAMP-responsive element-binding protein-like 2 [Strongylocentrotus purpuratus]|eukprot:XP_003729367.2 PREDICTED: cAMP-responsive element-binding protein-like 2 [Strongylocentrotus purpuratus]
MTKPDFGEPDNMEESNDMASSKPGRSSSRLRRVQSSGGKRGRRPSRVDRDAKLERSRQSARECRARKKQKYQLLEETVAEKEKKIVVLREKLEKYKNFCQLMDNGEIPVDIHRSLQADEALAVKEAEAAMRPSTSKSTRPQPVLATGVDSSSEEDSD